MRKTLLAVTAVGALALTGAGCSVDIGGDDSADKPKAETPKQQQADPNPPAPPKPIPVEQPAPAPSPVDQPEDEASAAFDRWAGALSEGDAAASCEELSESSLRALESKGGCEAIFGAAVDQMSEAQRAALGQIEVTNAVIAGETGVLSLDVPSELASIIEHDIQQVVQEDGSWKLEHRLIRRTRTRAAPRGCAA